LVNNKAKLAYNSMSDWLNNKKDMPPGLKNALTKQV
jgi:exoribonuclease II